MASREPNVDALLTRLSPLLANRLRTDAEALEKVSNDESGLPAGHPAAVVFPLNTGEVSRIAQEAADLGVGLVPRGGGTGKAGGCIPSPGEVVVDLSRMNRILELRPSDLYAVVQPGVITLDLDNAAHEHNLMYAPRPGSYESCTLGGNISTNAGGSRALKYGSTQRHVWGLELVVPGGSVMRVGRHSQKGVGGLDLTSLLVGSEGTLAFVTEATLHLIPAPKAVETAWINFPDIVRACQAGDRLLAAGIMPRIMEVMDQSSLTVVRRQAPFHFSENAGAAMLIETDGGEEQAQQDLYRLVELATECGGTDSAIAKSEKQRDAMRKTRQLVATTLKDAVPFKISDDVAVPRSRVVELLSRVRELGEQHGIATSAYGHLGDGNMHINLHCQSAEHRLQAAELRRQIMMAVVALNGMVSGEHGIGIAKKEALALQQSSEVLLLQKQLKTVFDPKGIMNPGKVFP